MTYLVEDHVLHVLHTMLDDSEDGVLANPASRTRNERVTIVTCTSLVKSRGEVNPVRQVASQGSLELPSHWGVSVQVADRTAFDREIGEVGSRGWIKSTTWAFTFSVVIKAYRCWVEEQEMSVHRGHEAEKREKRYRAHSVFHLGG